MGILTQYIYMHAKKKKKSHRHITYPVSVQWIMETPEHALKVSVFRMLKLDTIRKKKRTYTSKTYKNMNFYMNTRTHAHTHSSAHTLTHTHTHTQT